MEAIGARRMAGVKQNLSAMLDDRFHRGKYEDISDRAEPATVVPALLHLLAERPDSGRYRAADLLTAAR